MTKKTYVMTIEYDETKDEPTGNMCTVLGIAVERAFDLFQQATKDMMVSAANGEETFNSLQSLMTHLDNNEYTGNEILLMLHSGYAAMNPIRIVMGRL